jgi:hypothetical protein
MVRALRSKVATPRFAHAAMLATLAACAIIGPVSAASATTVEPPPPHHPERALCAMTALVEAIDRHDLSILSNHIMIYSNAVGEVTRDELDRFFAEFDATGRDHSEPLRLWNWGLLQVDGVWPLYVMEIRRGSVDGHMSTWLVQFTSDRISVLRRADELWPFATGKHFFAPAHCSEAQNSG